MNQNLIKEKLEKYKKLSKKNFTDKQLIDYCSNSVELDSTLNMFHDVLNKFKKTSLGLVTEEVRLSPEYRRVKLNYDNAFEIFRSFNDQNKEISIYYNKHFTYIKKEDFLKSFALHKKNNTKTITIEDFKELASRGRLQQSRNAFESIEAVESYAARASEVNFTDDSLSHLFNGENGDFCYEMLWIEEYLEQKNIIFFDDKRGNVFVANTKEDLELIKNADSPVEFGRLYGYSEADIAKFYLNLRGGNAEIAYEEYLEDIDSSSVESNMEIIDRYVKNIDETYEDGKISRDCLVM